MGSTFTIGQIAALGGVETSTIRYYERIGILPRPERVSGRRVYKASILKRLALIRAARAVGFTIEEIYRLLSTWEVTGKPPAEWQEFIKRKVSEIEHAITEAEHIKTLLEAFLACDCIADVDISLEEFLIARPLPMGKI